MPVPPPWPWTLATTPPYGVVPSGGPPGTAPDAAWVGPGTGPLWRGALLCGESYVERVGASLLQTPLPSKES